MKHENNQKKHTVAEAMAHLNNLEECRNDLIQELLDTCQETIDQEALCENCEDQDDCDFFIPPCLLDLAGITSDDELDLDVQEGKITIFASYAENAEERDKDDTLNLYEKSLLKDLAARGLDLNVLSMLLQRGRTFFE